MAPTVRMRIGPDYGAPLSQVGDPGKDGLPGHVTRRGPNSTGGNAIAWR